MQLLRYDIKRKTSVKKKKKNCFVFSVCLITASLYRELKKTARKCSIMFKALFFLVLLQKTKLRKCPSSNKTLKEVTHWKKRDIT